MLSITLTRRQSFDPLSMIEQATRQAVAQQIAREHAAPNDPEALSFRYEKDSNSEGDYVDLVISGTDQVRVGLVLRRLRAHGYDVQVGWLSDEDPPHLVRITGVFDGEPAPPSRAREILDEMGYHAAPLVEDGEQGFYKTLISATFPPESVATLPDNEWKVCVIHRG